MLDEVIENKLESFEWYTIMKQLEEMQISNKTKHNFLLDRTLHKTK